MDEDDGKKWRDHECGTSPHFSHSPLNFARVRRRSPGVTPEPWRSCGLKQKGEAILNLARTSQTPANANGMSDNRHLRQRAVCEQFIQFVARCDDLFGRKKAQKSQKRNLCF